MSTTLTPSITDIFGSENEKLFVRISPVDPLEPTALKTIAKSAIKTARATDPAPYFSRSIENPPSPGKYQNRAHQSHSVSKGFHIMPKLQPSFNTKTAQKKTFLSTRQKKGPLENQWGKL
jgi:hypothetical protein